MKRKTDEREGERKKLSVEDKGFLMRMRSRGELIGTFAGEVSIDILCMIDLFAKPLRGVLHDSKSYIKQLMNIALPYNARFADIDNTDTIVSFYKNDAGSHCVERGPQNFKSSEVGEVTAMFGTGIVCARPDVMYCYTGRKFLVCWFMDETACFRYYVLSPIIQPINMVLDSCGECLYLPHAASFPNNVTVWKLNITISGENCNIRVSDFTLCLPPYASGDTTLVAVTSEKRFVMFDGTTVLFLREDGQVMTCFVLVEHMSFLAIESTDAVLFWKKDRDDFLRIVRLATDRPPDHILFPGVQYTPERVLLSPNNALFTISCACDRASLWIGA